MKRYRVFLQAFLLVAAISISQDGLCASIIPTTKVAQHVGEFATVQGTVTEVYVSRKGHVFLDMDGRYPNNTFSGVIFREYASLFPNVEDLQDKVVRVTGTIQLYKGKPEIVIRDKSQIQVVR